MKDQVQENMLILYTEYLVYIDKDEKHITEHYDLQNSLRHSMEWMSEGELKLFNN